MAHHPSDSTSRGLGSLAHQGKGAAQPVDRHMRKPGLSQHIGVISPGLSDAARLRVVAKAGDGAETPVLR
jgi:hypothetical protein